MNQMAAFADTLALARDRNMELLCLGRDRTLSFGHIRDMYDTMSASSPSEAKLGRWLGWAQCAVVACGCATLDEMKQINLLWSDK